MAAWSLRPSAADLEFQSQSERTSEGAGIEGSTLPAADYFIRQHSITLDEEDPFDLKNHGPVARSIVESTNRFYIERNLFSHLHTTFQPRTVNHYNDEEIEMESMAFRPHTFIFLGKPGVGKTTQAIKLAEKLNAVLISPQSIISHYKFHDIPDTIKLDRLDGTLSHEAILALTSCRLMELDVFHKGYVMDGFPLIKSKEISVEDQLKYISSLPIRPHHVIILHMQDLDLFKRRRDQKFDPMTSIVYTRDHYIHKQIFDPVPLPRERRDPIPSNKRDDDEDDEEVSPSASKSKRGSEETFEDSELGSSQDLSGIEPFGDNEELPDFEPLPPHVIKRLTTRVEDLPFNVARDFTKFREARPHLQAFIDLFDRRRVLELNAYWQPSIIFKMILEFTENFGISPSPIPSRLISKMENPGMFQIIPEDQYYDSDELGEEEEPPCIPYEDVFTGEVDWEAALRAVTVRSRVDPRFRWRISQWKNICPVALKLGNTVIGKPERAIGYMDKVYFLSTEEAVQQFEFNPRPYLLPTMPTSPVKFFITGHPLAGKTLFAQKLAQVTGGVVIDMKRQLRKRYHLVKADYLFRIRLEGVLEITRKVDKDNYREWKRQERNRRDEVMKWIERFIRMRANAELNAMLEMEQEARRKRRMELRAASEHHSLGEIYSGGCTVDTGTGVGFTWNDFVKAMREGRRNFSHQQKLELAWQLFHEGKLRYKVNKRALGRLIGRQKPRDSVEEEEDVELDGEDIDFLDIDEESPGEGSEESLPELPVKRKRRRRRRKICAPVTKSPETDEEDDDLLVKVESVESSVFGSDEESDESIRQRFPEIPIELIEGIPRPSNVTEKHPQVLEELEKRYSEAEAWVDGSPPEMYIEVLKLAIAEAEEQFLSRNPHGPISGGWIIDNLALDIEKWRMFMRTSETKPDNVIILQDNSPGHPQLLRNLKQAHKNAKPIRYSEYPGEGGEGELEFAGEDGIRPAKLGKSQLNMSMSEFLVKCLPIDELGLGAVADWENPDAQVITELRNASLADSILDADQKKILTEWLDTFDKASDMTEQELSVDPNRDQSLTKHVTPPAVVTTFGSTELDKADWTPRRVNYEMLSMYHFGEASSTESRIIPVDSVASEPIIRKTTMEELLDEYQDVVADPLTKSLFNLLGEDGQDDAPDSATPRSLLSKEDILCAAEIGPEEPPCVPFTHDPSLKRVFERQIQGFDDFYNMAHSLLQKENIRGWQIGIVDPDNAYDKALNLWEELERRFEFVPSRLAPSQLKEEMDEWSDANKSWGMVEKKNGDDEDDEYGMGEDDDEDEDEDEEEEDGEGDDGIPGDYRRYKDPFEKLKNRPEEYMRAVLDAEKLMFYGDLKYYCPVTLYQSNILRRGRFAAKWLDRTYLMANPEYLDRFLDNPTKFLSTKGPLPVPPPRICVTGSPGCGQEEVALKVGLENNIYFVNFRQRIHEILKVKLGKDTGPGQASTLLGTGFIGENPSSSSISVGFPGRYSDEEEGEFGDEEAEAERRDQKEIENLALQNFGILKPINVSACPLTKVERTEKLAERDWKLTMSMEYNIKEFLEYGEQLSDEVLDEFVAPLWNEEPFRSKGFILVGFPNTAADIEYLLKRKCFPEYVHIMDSKSRTMRNRLVLKTVADYKKLHPEKRRKSLGRGIAKRQPRVLSEHDKAAIMNEYMPLPVSDDEEKANRWKIQKDMITERVTRSLLHYHRIYSKGLKGLEMAMNKERVDWNVLHTDRSINESKRALAERLTAALKYRSSTFEATFELSLKEAASLIDRAYFRLSKFGRMCPVEVFKGNSTVNLWNAPGVVKYPYLYRNYIYFVAGAENAKLFRQNVWNIVKQEPPTPNMPLFIIINGPPKSGKTELASRIANKLGLIYVSQESVVNDCVKHSFLNQDFTFDMSPQNLASGPASMTLADEILAYLRAGLLVPQYMFYRALDLALMAPRAQFHGAVFDDYPIEEAQLQELLERGIVPSLVVRMNMDPAEGYRRADSKRFNPAYNYEELTEECNGFMDYLIEDYQPSIDPCFEWYENEIQCLLDVDSTQSPTTIFEKIRDKALDTMVKMQKYIRAVLTCSPASLLGVSPLTSMLHSKLSQSFGSYDPVALNERNELIRVKDLSDLSRVIEYLGEIYAFSNLKNVEMFLATPEKYTYPGCLRLPPVEVPVACILTEQEMNLLKEHFGFMTFDPVFYVEGNMQFKWLKECDGKFAVEYREKLYFFLSASNQEKFLRQPDKYTNIPTPTKLPGKSTRPLDSLSPSGYVIATGLTQQLSQMLGVIGSKRPRFPFMSSTRSGLLYMGYYLKTLNNSSPQLRKHYRRAMAHMSRTQHIAEQLTSQIQKLHGHRLLPPLVKKRLDTYLLLANKPDHEKVVDPVIPDLGFNFDAVPDPEEAILKGYLDELLNQEQRCGGGDWAEAESTIGDEEEGEEVDKDSMFQEPPLIDLDNYVPPAYLAKDRLM